MRLIGSVAAAGALLAARQFYRNWGTTKEECQTPLPGDELIGQPAVQTTEGVWIDAPAADVWPWLVQMGQDRGGLYSYEGLENAVGLKYRNADRIHPEWQHLEAGDVIRVVPRGWMGLSEGIALPVAQVIEGESIVLRLQPPQLPFDGVWSFHVIPRWEDRCRLLVRSRTRMQAPGEVLGAEAAGPVLALMTRGMLLGIKRRVEANRSTG
ncbi:MAG: SRPBCC family protein [Mycobacterium sp.]|nr:MAG: SRPBCC family protein [Mycobacterium sp.]HPZ94059.1 SRPBCC family protein [Mycobacterium sp.]HQE15350.1 SRPBCC family protein [Mycobacterium sp.]